MDYILHGDAVSFAKLTRLLCDACAGKGYKIGAREAGFILFSVIEDGVKSGLIEQVDEGKSTNGK